jgi:hypothetical protein
MNDSARKLVAALVVVAGLLAANALHAGAFSLVSAAVAAILQASDGSVDINTATGVNDGALLTDNTNHQVCLANTATSGGRVCVETQASAIGAVTNRGYGENVLSAADSYVSQGSRTILWGILGTGIERHANQAALTITSPTDTSTQPGTGGTGCLMSSSGAAAWTPSETSAIDGMYVCCVNTGANAITMTTSAGVYQGSGAVVGQYDTVCMRYISDRWVEQSFKDNT